MNYQIGTVQICHKVGKFYDEKSKPPLSLRKYRLHPLISSFVSEKHTTTCWGSLEGGKVEIKVESVD